MDVQDLVARFPEIPEALHSEELLSEFAAVFGDLLQTAWKPSNCGGSHQTAENVAYMKLIAPLTYLRYGLSTREKTLDNLRALIEAQNADPQKFRAELIPAGLATTPGGCGEHS